MNKPNYDLIKDKCHVCGQPLWRDYGKQTEKCINGRCKIRNVEFTIPIIQDEEDE